MPQNAMRKNGIVQAFNASPKGAYEGLLLQAKDELIQINFPQEFAAKIAELAPPESAVQVQVEPQETKDHACHPVFRLVGLINSDKGKFSLAAGNGHKDGHFSGKVERLNYALHGEVNGAILDSGDFLHVKPHGAAALELTVGMKVKGNGATKPMIGGQRVIEAEEVNGLPMEHKPKPKKKAHK